MTIDLPFLNSLAEDLPIIRPLKEFVHLNLLLRYQDQFFWEALKKISRKLEAYPFNKVEFYLELLKNHPELEPQLRNRLQMRVGSLSDQAFNRLQNNKIDFVHHDFRIAPLHDAWNKVLKVHFTEMTDGILIKWLSQYLDQGIGEWEMPNAHKLSFYESICHLLEHSIILPTPFDKKRLEKFFSLSAQETVNELLPYLCPVSEFQREYVKESIMTLRGWSGLIFTIQQNPELLALRRTISLMDFVAVRFLIEYSWMTHTSSKHIIPDFEIKNNEKGLNDLDFETLRACQEIYEEQIFDEFLVDLKEEKIQVFPNSPDYQAVFCMDDRESPLRKIAEKNDPKLETWGTAAHFGVLMMYHHSDYAFSKKHCPAPATPQYIIREHSEKKHKKKTALTLMKDLFFPLWGHDLSPIVEEEVLSKISLFRENDDTVEVAGLKPGYTFSEAADLIYSQLELIGLLKLTDLVLIIGHGSTSANNPYFTSYGCGACSGRSGEINARVFCALANHPEVRKIIKTKYNFEIDDKTYFQAGFHDTTMDLMKFFNTSKLPAHLRGKLDAFKEKMSVSLKEHAESRSKQFTFKIYNGIKETRFRSLSFFQPRPELGHTNVSYSIVGRRENFKHLNINRAAFAQSYDPTIDPDASILTASLSAVIPVTSGINLDYYFSSVDNQRLGAGSKLPQNVVGHLGVSHGTESDLRFGLPFQMIDQNRPTRIFILVEQTPELALKAVQNHPGLYQVVSNAWIYYASYEVGSGIHLFIDGQMKKINHMGDLWK